MHLRLGVVSGSLSSMLSTWKNRKYIECYGEEVTGEKCHSVTESQMFETGIIFLQLTLTKNA